ncbi:NADH dehydrogenase [ubiquinone] 1 beta subcomplex subunit 8, mitochondrial-like [Clytia hemisphaerica]|uniref:NADH dehydrogenase [ubiquinone] 1 beta subcomplex subunit 8, mitochondrial n=1 Tax=Clytia hemisphaerica TaxID=252671 RepID=A0A7M5V718_9CNID
MAARISQVLKRSLFSQSKTIQKSTLSTTFVRNGSTGNDPPAPPIKPPGKEFIDQGWKDDGLGLGDYPNYKEWSYQNRDPTLPYWDQQERRHFGEPLHVNHDALNIWMPDDISNHRYTPKEMALHLSIALGLLGGLIFYSEYVYDAPSRDPAAPKPYPYNNLYLEMGGDPDKEPTEYDLKRKIPRPHYGW